MEINSSESIWPLSVFTSFYLDLLFCFPVISVELLIRGLHSRAIFGIFGTFINGMCLKFSFSIGLLLPCGNKIDFLNGPFSPIVPYKFTY